MKKIKMAVIINILMISFFSFVCASEFIFFDLEEHWAKDFVSKAVLNNIINGYEDGTFKPDECVTIAEFLKMVVCAGKYDLIRHGDCLWPDFYINTATENNLIFEKYQEYNNAITRYQACDIIYNFIGNEEVKISKNKFKDLDSEYEEKILKLVELEIVDGYKDKTFKGENHLTRAEAVVLILRACDTKETLVKNRKYNFEETGLSNYYFGDIDTNSNFSKTRYAVENTELLIYDDGKYAKLDAYKFSGEIIENEKIIKLIKSLLNEKAYVAVFYQPSIYTINQLQILYGVTEAKVACNEIDFSFTFYENKYYDLSTGSMEEKFSDSVFAKLEVVKLWENYSDFKSGKVVDAFKKAKLKSALNIICKYDAEKICNYIIQKNKEYVSGEMQKGEIKEHKVFSNYVVDFYKKENGVPTFYFSER